MKRSLLLFVAFLLFINLSACSCDPNTPAVAVSFPVANFNNNYWFSGDFWAFDDNIFYLQDGFYNMGVYWGSDGNRKKLFEESDFSHDPAEYRLIGDIFICDKWLYFELLSDEKDMLYRYDLNEGVYAPVCETTSLFRWVVVDDYFIYRKHPSDSNERCSSLYVYNLVASTTTLVCSNVEEFGVVDGQLRYITYADAYTLYGYDYIENRSTILGSFDREFDDKYDIFNFTPNSIVMLNWDKEHDQNLVIYTISSDSTAAFTLPKKIHNIVAYDRYAYAIVYDTQESSSQAASAKENGIYRINLTDGNYEIVERNANDHTEIHVVSDDRIYIVQGEHNFIPPFRQHVYTFDYTTGSKEKLTTIAPSFWS